MFLFAETTVAKKKGKWNEECGNASIHAWGDTLQNMLTKG